MRRQLSFVFGAAIRALWRPNLSAGTNPALTRKLQARKTELIEIILLTLPVIFSYLLEMGLSVITLIAVGRLGVAQLDGASLGSMIANVTGIALMCGLALAMDTLAAQAFGAGNYKLVGLLAQRGVLIGLLFCSPMVVLWWCIEPVLLFLNQDPEVSRWAARFLRCTSFGFAPLVVLEIMKKFITAQGIVTPISLIMLFAVLFHSVTTYLFIWPLGFGFDGCGLALSLSYTVTATLCVLYVVFARHCTKQDPLKCWGGFSCEAFQDWGLFLKMGSAGAAHLCLEWWAYEVLALISGVLGTTSLAATTVAMQVFNVAFNIPVGVSIATTIRVGQSLGNGSGPEAKVTCWLAVAFSTAMTLVAGAVVLAGRSFWGSVFTAEPEVLHVVEDLIFYVAAMVVLNGPAASCSGVLLGSGRQFYGAAINFVGYWMLGVPFGILSTFWFSWGVYGLWSGLVLGIVVMNVLLLWFIQRLDWDGLAEEAYDRAALESDVELAPASTQDGRLVSAVPQPIEGAFSRAMGGRPTSRATGAAGVAASEGTAGVSVHTG